LQREYNIGYQKSIEERDLKRTERMQQKEIELMLTVHLRKQKDKQAELERQKRMDEIRQQQEAARRRAQK
jgi:hypothetical protein